MSSFLCHLKADKERDTGAKGASVPGGSLR